MMLTVMQVRIKNFDINGGAQSVKGYMWVTNAEQLQDINTNLSGNYALKMILMLAALIVLYPSALTVRLKEPLTVWRMR